jgi:hypothetical protein
MVQTAGPYPRPLVLLIAAAVGWTVFTLVRFQMPAGNGLAARYYNNASLAGVPVETGYDPVPSAARMAGRWQGRPPLAFGVVWTGYLTVGSTDQYRFATTSDDGSKLFVDERLVVDNSGPHGSETKTGTIALLRGSHRVRLEYTQFGGASELIWAWGRGDAPLMPVPAWALSRRAVRDATLTVLRLVEIVRWLAAILGATAAAWYIAVSVQRVSPRQMAKQAADAYGGAASLAFTVCILVAFLLMPWPGGHDSRFYRSVELTCGDFWSSLRRVARDPRSFQSNLSTPLAGEEGAGSPALQAVGMLRARSVDRYELSTLVKRDDWVSQQIVASAWPRKREADAHVHVILNSEPTTGCEVVSRDRDVSLVYCP